MRAFNRDDFDIHTAAEAYRDRPRDGQSLCTGCKNGHIYRRRGDQDISVHCHSVGRNMPPDIVECSEFRPVASLSLTQMHQIALPVDPRPGVNDGSDR
jgi:hypothetical protein